MVLGKTRFGGFFLSVEKALADEFRVAGEGFKAGMVNGLHQSAGMSSVYASPMCLIWIHQLSRRKRSGSRMIDHWPGWLPTGCRNGLEKPA